jgi:hypothetical protein
MFGGIHFKSLIRPLGRAIPSLIGILLGFALATSWDLWKTHRDQSEELFRAARAVYQELTANSESIKFNLSYLDTDISAAQSNSEVVPPMFNFVTTAGDTAYLKGSFEYRSVEMAVELRKIYSSLYFLNKRIEQREMYRFTNSAMSNFGTRRIILDQVIKTELVKQQELIDKFVAMLKESRLVK